MSLKQRTLFLSFTLNMLFFHAFFAFFLSLSLLHGVVAFHGQGMLHAIFKGLRAVADLDLLTTWYYDGVKSLCRLSGHPPSSMLTCSFSFCRSVPVADGI